MSSTEILKDIAGARITQKFLSVREDETIGGIRKLVSTTAKESDVIDYVYVVDEANVLRGVISLKEVLQSLDTDVQVKSAMKRKVVSIDFHADQERIVHIVLKEKLRAIPVVDGSTGRLQGVVPYDAILSVFHHEFREDLLKSGGIHHGIKEIEELGTPASRLVRARIPSLMAGLLGGLLAAAIIGGFEDLLSSYIILAAFIPVMIYLSDAVGTQSQTLAVRMIALEPTFSVVRYILRELQVGSAIAGVFALLLFLAAVLGWSAPLQIGLAIAASIFASIVFQCFLATFLSIALSRLKIDPATTSGPLTTVISDITTLVMYFVLASSFLRLTGCSPLSTLLSVGWTQFY